MGSKKLTIIVGVALVLSAALTGASIWFYSQAAAQTQLRPQLQEISVSFPLFYPQKLPDGFTEVAHSAGLQDGVVMFALTKGDAKVIVTEQPRPKLMEEVNKIKDVSVPVGKAYIATLNEHMAGFLVTDKTLIILSTTQTLDVGVFEALLQAMVAL